MTLVLAGIITHQGNKTNGAYASVTINLPREYCLFAWLASPLYFKEHLPSPSKLFRIGLYDRLKIGMATLRDIEITCTILELSIESSFVFELQAAFG